MTTGQRFHSVTGNPKRNGFVLVFLLLLCVLTVAADLFFAHWQGTGFYLSESLLFSSFWLLFFPFLQIPQKLGTPARPLLVCFLFPVLATGLHMVAYPAVVWLLSCFFYDHTFRYWQTFRLA